MHAGERVTFVGSAVGQRVLPCDLEEGEEQEEKRDWTNGSCLLPDLHTAIVFNEDRVFLSFGSTYNYALMRSPTFLGIKKDLLCYRKKSLSLKQLLAIV